MTVDLNLGVMVRETIIEAINAMKETAIRGFFLFHM